MGGGIKREQRQNQNQEEMRGVGRCHAHCCARIGQQAAGQCGGGGVYGKGGGALPQSPAQSTEPSSSGREGREDTSITGGSGVTWPHPPLNRLVDDP